MTKLHDSLFPSTRSGKGSLAKNTFWSRQLWRWLRPATSFQGTYRKTPIYWPNILAAPAACFACTWKSSGSLPPSLSFEEITPLDFPHKPYVPTTKVVTRAPCWTQPRIRDLVIPVCELSSPFAFLPLHFCYLCVRKFYCSVTSPSVFGKNTNTSICSVLCSLQNDITYTNLF